MYRNITYERKCDGSSGITLQSISDSIRNIEFLERTYDRDVIKCLEHCKELYLKHPLGVWKNAQITVYGRFLKVLLVAGDGLNCLKVHLDKKGNPVPIEAVKLTHIPPPPEYYSAKSSEVCRDKEYIGHIECKPYITFKHIKDALEERASRLNTFRMKDDVKACLRYSLRLLKENDSTVWKNARISIYGMTLTIILSSGSETHRFEVTCNKEPVHFESKRQIDRDVEKKCEPQITYRQTSACTNQLVEQGIIWMQCDILLLKYCYTVLKDFPKEVWSDAEINVCCSKTKVCFHSGERKFKFEIVLGSDNQPVCLQTDGSSIDKDITEECNPFISFKNVQDVIKRFGNKYDEFNELKMCMKECKELIKRQSVKILSNASIKLFSRQTLITFKAGAGKNQFDIIYGDDGEVLTKVYSEDQLAAEEMREKYKVIKRKCSPAITFEDVYEVMFDIKHGRLNRNSPDYFCLMECKKLIQELPLQDLANCQIKLYCEQVLIIFVSGKGFNCFDVIDTEDGKVLTKRYTTDDLEQANYQMAEVITCSKSIKDEDINKLLKKLKHSSNEELRKCLQHCIKLIHRERKEYGLWIWENAEILVSTSDANVKFLSGNGGNKYKVCLDENGRATDHCEARNNWKRFADFKKSAASVVTGVFSTALGAIGQTAGALTSMVTAKEAYEELKKGDSEKTGRLIEENVN